MWWCFAWAGGWDAFDEAAHVPSHPEVIVGITETHKSILPRARIGISPVLRVSKGNLCTFHCIGDNFKFGLRIYVCTSKHLYSRSTLIIYE